MAVCNRGAQQRLSNETGKQASNEQRVGSAASFRSPSERPSNSQMTDVMLKDFSIYADSSTILALCHGSDGQYIWATLPVPVDDDAWGSPLNEASSQAQGCSAIHALATAEPVVTRLLHIQSSAWNHARRISRRTKDWLALFITCDFKYRRPKAKGGLQQNTDDALEYIMSHPDARSGPGYRASGKCDRSRTMTKTSSFEDPKTPEHAASARLIRSSRRRCAKPMRQAEDEEKSEDRYRPTTTNHLRRVWFLHSSAICGLSCVRAWQLPICVLRLCAKLGDCQRNKGELRKPIETAKQPHLRRISLLPVTKRSEFQNE
ncbi:hypothetical protein FKW77_010852 [Venturia effusa]|uniref:Uncharacterized protein n=1 Tax=Venturia effusa TaxID=50376 RepID=A0A517KYM6_9PEZI|nr:hypothetical protein FKW77_010852 [Venturia effusa]